MAGKLKALTPEVFSSHFHLINGENTYLFFDIEDLSLFEVNKFTYNLFLQIQSGRDIKDIIKDYGYKNLKEFYKLISRDKFSSNKNSSCNIQKSILDRLVLNISNDCNLNCRYCYAFEGTYNEEISFMEEEVALKTIDYFYNIYPEINNIQFFGGEPLLNTNIIDSICSYILKKYDNGEIAKLPAYSVVTNGTIMSSEILRIFQTYRIGITVSMDGPRFIHEYLRGKDTSKKITPNIHKMKDNGINVGIECTFTNYHLINNFHVFDLVEFFNDQFGIHITHVPFVATTEENELYICLDDLINEYTMASKFALDSICNGKYMVDSYTLRLIKAILYKEKIEFYCPAGITTLSVSTNGEIYPCFMFTGKKEFSIGNVLKNEIDIFKLSEVNDLLKRVNKLDNPECRSCWAKSLCFGCIGNDYILTGSIEDKPNCDFIKRFIENFLLEFTRLSQDSSAVLRIISLMESIKNK